MTIEIENRMGLNSGKSIKNTPDMVELLAPILSKMTGIQKISVIQITNSGQ